MHHLNPCFPWLAALAALALSAVPLAALAGEKDAPEEGVTVVVGKPAEARSDGAPPPVEEFTPLVEPKEELATLGGQRHASSVLRLDSWCGHPFQAAVYTMFDGYWSMHAWYHFAAWEGPRALGGAFTNNRYVYVYAETTDGSGIVWEGGWELWVPDWGYEWFYQWDTGPSIGTHTLRLYC